MDTLTTRTLLQENWINIAVRKDDKAKKKSSFTLFKFHNSKLSKQ